MLKTKRNIAIGAGILLLIMFLRRKLYADNNAPQNNSRLAQLAAQGIRPTQPNSTYAAWADVCYSVMDKSAVSEAPNKNLYLVIDQLKNEADWIKLKMAYGTRQLRAFGIPDGSPMNLPEALAYENHFAEVQRRLRGKGISI